MSDTEIVQAIHKLLDGAEWSANTTLAIASILHNAGYVVRTREEAEYQAGESDDTSLDRIALVWSTEDVLTVRPTLSRNQARKVLADVEHNHDATQGVTWNTIEMTANLMFPQEEA